MHIINLRNNHTFFQKNKKNIKVLQQPTIAKKGNGNGGPKYMISGTMSQPSLRRG